MIPAGIIDKNIEIFFQDKVYIIHGGRISDLVSIPDQLRQFLQGFIKDEIQDVLRIMNVQESKYLEKFLQCRYGKFDFVPDFTDNNETNPEYYPDCPERHNCPGCGIVCLRKWDLTKREIEIARLTTEDLADKQIADKLNVSYLTVRKHQKNIQEKLNTDSKVGTAVFAIKHNL